MCEGNEIETKICSKCSRELPMTSEYFEHRKESKDGLRGNCRECRGRQFLSKDYKNIKTTKICKQCKQHKEINEDNFSKSVRNNDGFLNICNKCQIKNRGIGLKEGYKICIKCGRELELDGNHFTEDVLCLDGYRNVCLECQGYNFYPRNRDEWSQEDINILLKNYSYMSNEELFSKYFKTHTIDSMKDYATKILKLHKDEKYLAERYWTEEENQFLIENYSSMDTVELAEIFDKSEATIRTRAVKYGLIKDSWWTQEELNLLIKNYPCVKNIELQKLFIDRNYNSITNKAIDLGLKKDNEYLYDLRCKNIKINSEKLYKYIKNGNEIIKIHKFKGENNARYKPRIKINCANCGKEIYRLKSDIILNNNTFCSRECSANWKSENMSGINSPLYGIVNEFWTKEARLKQAENTVKRLLKSDFSYRKTKPQLIIDNLLDELKITNDNEYSCKYYLMDNYLIDYNLMIEVQGNFFHCNPVMNLENSRKTKILGKDKAKHTYVKKYHNIEILYLWGKDIIENIKLCKQLILEYINNNGILEDYHSYNYCLDKNDKIKLIENKYVIGY